MTSTTLSFKSNFSGAFMKTFKQRLVDMIILLAAAVIIPIGAVIITLNNNLLRTGYSSYGKSDITSGTTTIIILMAFVCGFYSLSIAPKMFKEIYKKQSCDLYFSLPIKREVYFCANYLYGLLNNIVAFVIAPIIYISVMPLLSTSKLQFVFDWHSLVPEMIAILLAVLVCYSMFVMCAVTAGKRFHYLVLSIILMLCTSGAISGIIVNLNSIWGLWVKSYIPMSIYPVQNAMNSLFTENILWLSLISVIEIIASFFAGLVVFKKRSAEVAEVTLTGKVIPYVILSVLLTGAYFYFSGIGIAILSVACGIFATVLLTMAFTGIFYKKVFTKKTGITAIAVCVVCSLFIVAVYVPDYNAYVKSVPDADDVESVTISGFEGKNVYLSSVLNILNTSDILMYEYSDGIRIEQSENIEKAISFHQRLIDDDVIKESRSIVDSTLINMLFFGYDEPLQTYDCRLEYKLKSGKTLSRVYSVNSKLIYNEYIALMQNEEVLRQLTAFGISNEDFLYAVVDTSFSTDEYEYYEELYNQSLAVEDYQELCDIYISDLLKSGGGNFIRATNTLGINYYSNNYSDVTSTPSAYVTIKYIRPDAPNEIRQKLKSMSPAELERGWVMWDFSEGSLFEYVDFECFEIFHINVNTMNYLVDKGIEFAY